MFGSALDKITEQLDKRFLLNALFPTLAFWGAALVLAAIGSGWNSAISWWHAFGDEVQTVIAIAAVAWLVFFASMLSTHVGAFLRLYEGYWGNRGPGKWLADWGKQRHRSHLSHLDLKDDREFEERYRRYPRCPEEVLPTALGNILKSAETYSADDERYSMDGVFFWPRLYAVLPDTVRADLSEARAALDLLVVTSALSWTFTVLAALYLGLTPAGGWQLWLSAVGGSAVIGWLAYWSAIRTAVAYAELVKSAFDLYRGDLIEQMGYAVPESLEAEREFWRNLGQQLYRRAADKPDVLKYAGVKPPPEKTLLEKLRELLSPTDTS